MQIIPKWRDFFPYNPRRGQVEMMDYVVDELTKGNNVAIEAQNGWGKTPTSIAAALASIGPRYDRVILCTRTHEQIRHVINEIRKVFDKKQDLDCVVLAAKSRLCINPWCRGEDFVNCNEYIVKEDQDYICSFEYLGDEHQKELLLLNNKPEDLPPILDIDTAKSISNYDLFCPYYLVKSASEFSNIIATPYNFIFSIPMRTSFGLDVSSSVIVVDEAHNLPSICRNLNSAFVSLDKITKSILFLRSNAPDKDGIRGLLYFRNWLDKFLKQVKSKKIKGWTKGFLRGNIFLRELYKELDKIYLINAAQALGNAPSLTIPASHVFSFISLLLSTDPKKSIAYITQDNLYYTMLDVREAVSDILNQGSRFLFLSGTLSPITSFKKEVGINVSYKAFENKLPARRFQVEIITSFEGVELTTEYAQRENEDVLIAYGKVLERLIRHIPNGSIIMFPSYRLKETMVDVWNMHEILSTNNNGMIINKNTRVYDEQKGLGSTLINRYKLEASQKQTALFSVFRGKVTEGTDLPHELCRGIFVIGIPFSNWGSPVVQGLIDYYNTNLGNSLSNDISNGPGIAWYYGEAVSVVNQGIGRGIRDPDTDYAKVFLIDKRYAKMKAFVYNKLSDWIRNNVINEYGSTLEGAEQRTSDFFKKIEKK